MSQKLDLSRVPPDHPNHIAMGRIAQLLQPPAAPSDPDARRVSDLTVGELRAVIAEVIDERKAAYENLRLYERLIRRWRR